jgi:HSP20 family protein
VQVDHGVLHISSERREESREDRDQYTRREFHYSAFERLFRLPEEADDEHVKATCSDGVLRLTIGKRAVARDRPGRRIQVE